MALVTETNQQYYAGAQGFTVQNAAGENSFTFTFDTNLILGSSDPSNINYQKNNFKHCKVIFLYLVIYTI